jgi:ABC-type antimicrobial peptide transport system permease subunit
MVFKNLFRRKGRTLLTIIGISIGVAAIIGLGAMAQGLEVGYNTMLSGSQADLVLSQPDSFDISYSSVDQSLLEELAAMPEVEAVSGMIEGYVQTENVPFLYLFGYPEDSFVLDRFQTIEGLSLFSNEAEHLTGKKIMLGSSAAEVLEKAPGDTLRLGTSVYRVTGIYETGDAFEDGGALLSLAEAQELLGKPRQVSLFYIQLESLGLKDQFSRRVERKWSDLMLSTTSDLADKQVMSDYLYGFAWAIGGLAIVLGGVGMMNTQLTSVYERTREIGVLRAIGWSRLRVMKMIFGESFIVCLAGGIVGIILGWLSISLFSGLMSVFGATKEIQPKLIFTAILVVIILGMIGGLYPAWRASRLQPVEALRYEGGSSGAKVHRLPWGGIAAQNLVQRTTRTLLTVSVIALIVGSIITLEAVVKGAADGMTKIATGSDVEIVVRQADIADTSLSALDERIGDKIAAMPEIESVSGIVFNFGILPGSSAFFILQGYGPNEFGIRHFVITEGERIRSNHQIMLGKWMAENMNKNVGDTIEVSGTRFRIVGIYEAGSSWEEMGGVSTIRDAQILAGRPRKVSFFGLKLRDPDQAREVIAKINAQFPEAHAALSGEFVDQLPDMGRSNDMFSGISLMAIVVGGVGVLNTMLMSVYERTREIGVLRALGWRRRGVLGLILKEALLLGILGGVVGIGVAYALTYGLMQVPYVAGALQPIFDATVFMRAFVVALLLGIIGGLYPAYRATRLQPVEALRYE